MDKEKLKQDIADLEEKVITKIDYHFNWYIMIDYSEIPDFHYLYLIDDYDWYLYWIDVERDILGLLDYLIPVDDELIDETQNVLSMKRIVDKKLLELSMKNILIFLSLTVLFVACNSHNKAKQSEVNLNLETTLDKNQKEWVERTLSEMSIREMTGQVVMKWSAGSYVPIDSDDFDNEIKVVDSGIGGIWFMGGSPYERAARTNEFQKHAKIPLLVTGWEGLGKKLLEVEEYRYWARGGGTDLPPAMAYGAIGDPVTAKEAGRILGMELRAIGDHIAGTPEVNVLLNLDNV